MKYRYIYQRGSAPLLSWKGGPPRQSRAADTVSLGSLETPTIGLPLPRPGSPEPVGGLGCGCDSRRDIVIDLVSPSFVAGAAVGFFLLGANYALYGVAPVFYPGSARGTGSGASVAVGRVGSILGPLLAGQLINRGISATDVVYYMVPVAGMAGAAVFALSFRKAH